MAWKKLTQKEKEYICYYEDGKSISDCNISLLNDLIDEFGFVEYNSIDFGCPIMYALRNGNYRLLYSNPRSNTAKNGYGIENPKILTTYKLMDHKLAFRTKEKKIYYASNPYLNDDEITEMIQAVINGDMKKLYPESSWSFKQYFGDYSDLKYSILGTEKSYYSPHGTNLVLLYT